MGRMGARPRPRSARLPDDDLGVSEGKAGELDLEVEALRISG